MDIFSLFSGSNIKKSLAWERVKASSWSGAGSNWKFLWWSGVLSVHVFSDQNRKNHTVKPWNTASPFGRRICCLIRVFVQYLLQVKFKQGRTGFMRKFEGCWKIEPIFVDKEVCLPLHPCSLEEYESCTGGRGRVTSAITLDQLIEPALLPPPPISWYLRGITSSQGQLTCWWTTW